MLFWVFSSEPIDGILLIRITFILIHVIQANIDKNICNELCFYWVVYFGGGMVIWLSFVQVEILVLLARGNGREHQIYFCIYSHFSSKFNWFPCLPAEFLSAFSMFVCGILDHFHSLCLAPMPALKEAFLYGLVSVLCLDKKLLVFVITHKWNVSYPYPECRVVFLLSLLLTYQYVRINSTSYLCFVNTSVKDWTWSISVI